MCGIAAVFAYDPAASRVSEVELEAITDAMAARGPDGQGVWRHPDGRIGMGHRRLAIIDLSDAGRQPMASADGRLHLVFNGEIYNHQDLRAELIDAGVVLRSRSDTEVLLHLYARHGAAMLPRLRGMFAFALWDEARQGMLVARDGHGIKPLYLCDRGGTVRLASQVKAILAGGAVPRRIHPAGAAGFLLWGAVPEPFTIVRDIVPVPPGSSLWIDRSGVGPPRRFWSLETVLAEAEAERPPGDAAGPGALREALEDTVRHHLVADVPVAVFLSAGLDSCTLASYAAAAGRAAAAGAVVDTVTVSFDRLEGTPADEAPLAAEAARALGTRHHHLRVSANDFAGDLEGLLRAMDQPSTDGVNVYYVSRAAARAGIKVALSGLGGDELFGTYPSFRDVPRLAARLGPLAGLRPAGIGFRRLAAPLLRRFTSPKYAGLLEYGTSVSDAYLLRRALYMPWELPDILGPEAARDGWAELEARTALRRTVAGLRDPWVQVAALEATWYMRNQLLRDADWASMAHGLELRVPLVDTALLGRLAPVLVRPARPSKRAMAESAPLPLPRPILDRPKSGFFVPLHDWLRGMRPGEATDRRQPDRGLRGWARRVLAEWSDG
ncbi:asparagine synthase (glutamine-hydrolyzing) [Rhodospirillum centenum]|uniref:asparagine synthase (glutamine-hydrolyzing) n=1 Tax=Rhodospirillum centenum (strain ATCC 51521 / SW) TaxID=414684 RepID=B6IYJ4_RHOCS|nr:asparagine synthase (glutamine-hydrolyzing) [Rhodospirillum centenum]ACJ01368.1 asparagine synthase (glutamine-hydrolyzing), putative [Rhodospirillum centenum SW]